MRHCMVAFCRNLGTIPAVRYFCVTGVTAKRRQAWLSALGRQPTEEISIHSAVCSKHFRDEDFEEVNNIQRLKVDAVPSLHLKPVIKRQLTFPQPSVSEIMKEKVDIEVFQPPDSIRQTSSLCPSPIPSTSQETVQISEVTDMAAASSESSTSTTLTSIDQSKKRKRELRPTSSDSEDLKGSPKKRRMLMRFMHNYSRSSRKMADLVDTLKEKSKKLSTNLRAQKAQIKRLQKRYNIYKK